jgi:hypothetical protein
MNISNEYWEKIRIAEKITHRVTDTKDDSNRKKKSLVQMFVIVLENKT